MAQVIIDYDEYQELLKHKEKAESFSSCIIHKGTYTDPQWSGEAGEIVLDKHMLLKAIGVKTKPGNIKIVIYG